MNTLKKRIARYIRIVSDNTDKVQKIAKYANIQGVREEELLKYLEDVKGQMKLADIGKLIIGLQKYAEELNSGIAKEITIDNLATDLLSDEYQKTHRVSGKRMLVEKLSESLPKKYADEFKEVDYAFDIIRNWEEIKVGDQLLIDLYIPGRLKRDGLYADKILDEWVKKDGMPFFLLLGDEGVGKTVCLQAFAARQAEKYIEKPEINPLPIYFDLSHFKDASNLISSIKGSVLYQHLRTVQSIEHLQKLIKDKKVFFIFDGFDQIEERVNSEDSLFEFLLMIEKFFHENGKLLLSSRPQAFKSHNELCLLMEKVGLSTAGAEELDVLTADNVDSYLQKRLSAESITQVKTLPGFRELSVNPMILNILIEVLKNKRGGITQLPLTKLGIFEEYCKYWYKRNVSRKIIDLKNILVFSQKLGYSMWFLERPCISYDTLRQYVGQHFAPEDPSTYENITRAIIRDSFLARNCNGKWFFENQSWYHFFIAKAIIEDENDAINALSLKKLPEEVIGFLRERKKGGYFRKISQEVEGESWKNKILLQNIEAIIQ